MYYNMNQIKKSQWYSQGTEDRKMIEAKKNERANALREVKDACKEFGFTVGMLKGWLAMGRGEK